MSRVCKIILVCEGWRDSAFARGFLVEAGVGERLLLPTRNLETWLYWLTGQKNGLFVAVDETTDYKQVGPPTAASPIGNEHCRPAGEWLHTLNHTHLPQGCPPMLRRALGQLREFLKAVRR